VSTHSRTAFSRTFGSDRAILGIKKSENFTRLPPLFEVQIAPNQKGGHLSAGDRFRSVCREAHSEGYKMRQEKMNSLGACYLFFLLAYRTTITQTATIMRSR
jgi:hypothetical protein